MKSTRTRDTAAERALRSALHGLGLRYRIHRRPVPGVRRQADVVFGPARIAVFVDGCFWHSCPHHGTQPKANAEWWAEKLDANRRRDEDTNRRFEKAGWLVIRVWEHEDPAAAAQRVRRLLERRRCRSRRGHSRG